MIPGDSGCTWVISVNSKHFMIFINFMIPTCFMTPVTVPCVMFLVEEESASHPLSLYHRERPKF